MFECRNDKHRAGRLRTALAVAAVTAVVASVAIVGTVAAQPGQRFRDVPRTHYAYQSIEWAVVNGITQDCGDGRYFCPDDTLNRAQMVTFLKRYHDEFSGATSTPTTTTTPASVPIRVRGSGSGFLEPAGILMAGTYRGTLALSLRGLSGDHEGILELTRATVSVEDSDGIRSVLHTVDIELTDYGAGLNSPLDTDDAPMTLTAPLAFRVGNNLNDIAPGPADIFVELIDRDCEITTSGQPCQSDTLTTESRFARRLVVFTQWEVVLTLR